MNAALTACAPSDESYGLSGSNEKGGSFVVHPVLREGATSDLIKPGEAKVSRRVPRGLGVRNGPRLPSPFHGAHYQLTTALLSIRMDKGR